MNPSERDSIIMMDDVEFSLSDIPRFFFSRYRNFFLGNCPLSVDEMVVRSCTI